MKRSKTQVTIRMIEYELYGRRLWWPESLTLSQSEDIKQTLEASGCQVKVHKLRLSNAETFVKPMRLPTAAARCKIE